MSVSIAPLDLGDPATLQRLVEVQRAGYRVEADLIGAISLPPLHETPEQLRAGGESFLGAFLDGALAGAVSWKRDGATVDIHRLVIDPPAFRRGLATRLLDALEQREADVREWTVGTGKGNGPARALYERRGFVAAEERIVPGGVVWVRMVRHSFV